MMSGIQVNFQPSGRRIVIKSGMTLLAAGQKAGIGLFAVCNGRGTCHQCIIRLIQGKLNPPTEIEKSFFSKMALDTGMRLACMAIPLADVMIDIPIESISTTQRLQLESLQSTIPVDPAVKIFEVELDSPSQTDLRSDMTRLKDALVCINPSSTVPIEIITQVSSLLRNKNNRIRVALHENGTIVGILEGNQRPFGLAIDIGTTKLAAYLVDLVSGKNVARQGAVNPQVSYGEDVISRIAYANQGVPERKLLQQIVVEGLNGLVNELCQTAGIQSVQIVDAVVVGNTTMHHLFTGLPTRQLGEAPYVAAVSEPLTLPARQLGLNISPTAMIYLPPIIAGFVGSDHVAADLASDILGAGENTLLVDIGTNTEISLRSKQGVLCCSCASGPAFEGAHITSGMRAAPGAIERVFYDDGGWHIATIDDKPAVGICGSGILDTIDAMHQAGIIDERGSLNANAGRVEKHGKAMGFLLVSADPEKGLDAIHVTRQDINEIQLAKAAIRAGIEILLEEAGLKAEDIHKFIIAGAFGSYLYIPSAVKIGMFPNIPVDHFSQIGNAAGAGARMMLVSIPARHTAENIYKKIKYVELSVCRNFQDIFMAAMPVSDQLSFNNR